MLTIQKDSSVSCDIPFGITEIQFPETGTLEEAQFYDMAEKHLAVLKEKYADYERQAVFSGNPYYRFFKKFKKSYPVMMQFESFLLKGRPFPHRNPITEIPFLVELETLHLLGTHDADQVAGGIKLFTSDAKTPFLGMRGEEIHTYPGDLCARDQEGIIFSMIAGADHRTFVRENSRHVFYPVFGVEGQSASELTAIQSKLEEYAKVLAPQAVVRQLIV